MRDDPSDIGDLKRNHVSRTTIHSRQFPSRRDETRQLATESVATLPRAARQVGPDTSRVATQSHANHSRTPRRRTQPWMIISLLLLGAMLGGVGLGIPNYEVTPRYVTKSIDDIRVGDVVATREEFGDRIATKPVVETYRRVADHLRILRFTDTDGHEQVIKTTDDHPFWVVEEERFIRAGDLKPFDTLKGPSDELQQVVSSVYESYAEGIEVFNLQVQDHHTYYVAERTETLPVLVHNADYTPVGGFDVPGDGDYLPSYNWQNVFDNLQNINLQATPYADEYVELMNEIQTSPWDQLWQDEMDEVIDALEAIWQQHGLNN
jgi:hypothetical protein